MSWNRTDLRPTAQARRAVAHYRGAAIYAAMEADEHLDAGDMDRAAFWRRVIAVIGELKDVPAGTVH